MNYRQLFLRRTTVYFNKMEDKYDTVGYSNNNPLILNDTMESEIHTFPRGMVRRVNLT